MDRPTPKMTLSDQITLRAIRILRRADDGVCPACGTCVASVADIEHHARDCSELREDHALAALDREYR